MEKPILFKAEMVRAILGGQKTQTRRVVKHIPALGEAERWIPMLKERPIPMQRTMGDFREYCPYGKPGARLWVREAWADLRGMGFDKKAGYKADGLKKNGKEDLDIKRTRLDFGVKWKPSIHMPRWACRLVLEITDIRVERLQDISEEDALAEGVTVHCDAVAASAIAKDTPARMEFWALWQSIHGKDGFDWEKNPWVWVIEFKKINEEGAPHE